MQTALIWTSLLFGDDLNTFTKIINVHRSLTQYEPNMAPIPLREVEIPKGKLSLGMWEWDGVQRMSLSRAGSQETA
jgi:hypothetical protein